MLNFDKTVANTEEERMEKLAWMHEFMNIKYEKFKSMWIDFDTISMQLGLGLCLHLFLFHQYTSFSRS